MKGASFDGGLFKTRRYQSLLQEYLELEKEFEIKKKRYEALKQKSSILMAEVRFLRRRYQHLLKIQAAKKELDEYHKLQSSNISQVQENTQIQAGAPRIGKTYLFTELHPILASVLKEGRSVRALPVSPFPANKRLKTSSINESGMMKNKKISWQDQEPVEV